MRERDFRKAVVDFILEQNSKCTPRAQLLLEVGTEKKEVKNNLSKKANDVRRILNSGTFGCNTEKVHSLMEVILEEKIPLEYKSDDNDENPSIFANYDRKKKFVNYCLLECSELQNITDLANESFYLKIDNQLYYDDLSYDDWTNISNDYFKYLEVATEEQVRTFIKNKNYDELLQIFAFLNLD